MERENVRIALNKFLKVYFDACHEVYEEINFSISKPTVNEVITKFIDSGIVKKRKSEHDKRVSYIYLTDIGETLASTNRLESERAAEKILDLLSSREVKQLTKIFDKLGGGIK